MGNIQTDIIETDSGTLAIELEISERTVRDLASRGIIVRLSDGSYDLVKSIKQYYEHKLKKSNQDDQDIKSLQKRKLQLQLDEMEGRVIPAAEVEDFYQKTITVTRSRLLTIPKKVSSVLKHLTDEDSIEQELKKEIYEALEELSRGSDIDDE